MEKTVEGDRDQESRDTELAALKRATEKPPQAEATPKGFLSQPNQPSPNIEKTGDPGFNVPAFRVAVGAQENDYDNDDDQDDDVVIAKSKRKHLHGGAENKSPSPPHSFATTITGSSSGSTRSVVEPPHQTSLPNVSSNNPMREEHTRMTSTLHRDDISHQVGSSPTLSLESPSSSSGKYHQELTPGQPHQKQQQLGEFIQSSPPQGQQHGPSLRPALFTYYHQEIQGGGRPASSFQQHQHAGLPSASPSRYPFAIKLLVSNNVAGSIIGRQGQTISELQARSMSRIKLSQSGDYFPGTHDRVCLVQGEPGNIKTALRLLLERMYMLHEQESSQQLQHHQQQQGYNAWQQQLGAEEGTGGLYGVPHLQHQQPLNFVVRLLVPSSSCGMIIGKSGSNIKFLEEAAGVVSVRLSPKESAVAQEMLVTSSPSSPTLLNSRTLSSSERVLAITGRTLDSCLQCIFMVLEAMIRHPDVSRYSNMTTSYTRKTAAVTQSQTGLGKVSGLPSHHQLAYHAPQQYQHQLSENIWPSVPSVDLGLQRHPAAAVSSYPLLPPTGTKLQMNKAVNPPRRVLSSPDLRHTGQVEYSSKLELHVRQSQEQRVANAQYSHSLHYAFSTEPGHQSLLLPSSVASFDSGFDHLGAAVVHSASAPDLLSFHFDEALQLTPTSFHNQLRDEPDMSIQSLAVDAGKADTYLVPVAPTCFGQNAFQAQVAAPDSVIGSILGRAGKTLSELQLRSGTRIWISQRGEYLPGTRNRIVTIRGPSAESVWQAQMMIWQSFVQQQPDAAS